MAHEFAPSGETRHQSVNCSDAHGVETTVASPDVRRHTYIQASPNSLTACPTSLPSTPCRRTLASCEKNYTTKPRQR
eukprot:scaffold377305_cov33-Prasinocladus_malaysianus.AAC.1